MSPVCSPRARTALFLLTAAAWIALAAGCALFRGSETPPPPTPTELSPATATDTPLAPTPTPEEIAWRPVPTPPSAPALVEVLELPGPPAPSLQPAAIAALGERAYAASDVSANLAVIREGRVQAVLPLEAGPHTLLPDPARQRLYILNGAGRSITVVAGEQIVARWALPAEPTSGALVDDQLWIGLATGALARLDTADGHLLEPSPPPIEGMIQGLALVGERVLVGSHLQVVLYDRHTLQPVAAQAISGFRALAVAGDALYLCTDDLATAATWLERWNAQTLEPQGRLPIPDDTGALWVDAARNRAVLLGMTTHRISLLDLASGNLVAQRIAGLGPWRVAYDPATDRLYVTQAESHTVAILSAADLNLVGSVPTALQITALAAGPEPGSLLVGLNTGELRLLRRQGPTETWPVGVYPGEVAYLPALDRVAVVDRALGELLLLDRQGTVGQRYPTGANPRGLFVDAPHQSLYAGDLHLFWPTETTSTLRIPAGLLGPYPPVGILRDTRRDHLYAIAWNGIPGSNGGYQIVRESDGAWSAELPAPGRLSVIEALYDERIDRFYSTHAHMGEFGLQVAEGETLAEAAYIALDRYPQAMVLNPGLWHLWLALPAPEDEPAHTRLLALDIRSLAPVTALDIPDRIARMALDSASQWLYLAAADAGRIYLVQDVALPAPPAPVPTAPVATQPPPPTAPPPTATLGPTATAPRPTDTPTPTPTATPTCAYEVYPDLQALWEKAAPGGLGCAHGPAQAGHWGWQAFQDGEMFWIGATRQILILFADSTWTYVDDHWREGMPELSCEATPPQGLWQPIRGFGLAWCQHPGLRDRLGWALGSEQAFETLFQAFAGGSLVTHPEGGGFWIDRSGTYYRIRP